MKLFAIVDKSGNLLVAKRNEKYAWMAAEDMHHSPMGQLQNEGYRCIALHTYDPSKQVVVDSLVRDSVLWFVVEMEKKLKANDHKGGWDDCHMQYLLGRIRQEIYEMECAIYSKQSSETVISECADVANFAMMIADKFGKENPIPTRLWEAI